MLDLPRGPNGRFVGKPGAVKRPRRQRPQVHRVQRFIKGDTTAASARLAELIAADRRLVTAPEDLPSWKFFDPKRTVTRTSVGDPPSGRSALEGYVPPWRPSWHTRPCEIERKHVEPSAPSVFKQRLYWLSDCSDLSHAALAVVDLKRRGCKYPFGDPKLAGFHYCNHRKMAGLPYCTEHVLLCREERRR